LKPSLSKDTCTTATTATTTATGSTLRVGIVGHHSEASVLATLHCHAFLYPSWVPLVLRQPTSFWRFHPLTNCVVTSGTYTEISFGTGSDKDDFALALFQSLSVQHSFWVSFVLRQESLWWRVHQPAPKVYINCRRSSFRWVAALIYKLLLIAWDFWQYKTDKQFVIGWYYCASLLHFPLLESLISALTPSA
jgi:hypothetical protein